MSQLPSVLFYADFPEAELHAAKLDGELYRVDQCFSPIDEIQQRSQRALALVLATPFSHRLIAEQRSAAWILGALPDAPLRHQFCADISARVRPVGLDAVSIREVVIERGDLLDCSGLAVTTPLRTAVDLARASPHFADLEFRVVIGLMRIGGFGVDECHEFVDRRRNLPNKRLALERIDEAARRIQPPLTRYTS